LYFLAAYFLIDFFGFVHIFYNHNGGQGGALRLNGDLNLVG